MHLVKPGISSRAPKLCESSKFRFPISDACASSKVRLNVLNQCSPAAELVCPGIYPREPRNKKKASKSSTPATTFYYTKDVQYLLHEPLLAKFRDQKALSKKIARSLGRNEVGDAARLEKNGFRKLSLDHLVKERYPTFVDALRDLDDALSLLFLFASLPSTVNVSPKTIALCQRLCLEFQHYLIITHAVRKSFLSIKGIYYQATIQGQDILWLVPHRFVQRVTGDVDFRIMGTFLEFYTTLLGFVNFRLYTSIGLVYPPRVDRTRDEKGGELDALMPASRDIEGANEEGPARIEQEKDVSDATASVDQVLQNKVDEVNVNEEDHDHSQLQDSGSNEEAEQSTEAIDRFENVGAGGDTLVQPPLSNTEASTLFAPFTFFLSREAPRQPLEFILRAFGCKRVGWDEVLGEGAYTNNERDSTITHQVVDRPPAPVSVGSVELVSPKTDHPLDARVPPGYWIPGRTYIQPQWVWDCINDGRLLRPDLYAPGATLPPHLSPWVKPTKGAYDPTVSLEEQEREGEAIEFAEEEAEAAAIEAQEANDDGEVDGASEDQLQTGSLQDTDGEGSIGENGMHVAVDDDSEPSEADEAPFSGLGDEQRAQAESSDEDEHTKDLHQEELKAEAAGVSFASGRSTRDGKKPQAARAEARKKGQDKRRKEDEELQRRMGMMSGKKRKLMEKMIHGRKKGEAEAEALRRKRRKLEQEKESQAF